MGNMSLIKVFLGGMIVLMQVVAMTSSWTQNLE